MKTIRFYIMLALMMAGGIRMQAQELSTIPAEQKAYELSGNVV